MLIKIVFYITSPYDLFANLFYLTIIIQYPEISCQSDFNAYIKDNPFLKD